MAPHRNGKSKVILVSALVVSRVRGSAEANRVRGDKMTLIQTDFHRFGSIPRELRQPSICKVKAA
jgi:hypothetical protein